MSSIEKTSATKSMAAQTTHRVVPDQDGPVVNAADRWLITGAVLTGSLLFSPIGLVVIAIGFIKMAQPFSLVPICDGFPPGGECHWRLPRTHWMVPTLLVRTLVKPRSSRMSPSSSSPNA